MPKKMLVNMSDLDECRVAVVEDGQLSDLFIERTTSEHYVGNIYKGRVENVEPSIQAAFVDLGLERNGFLHVSDVNPDYFKHANVKRNHSQQFPRLQTILKRGQEVVVQVTKSGIGTKGPALTTYLSLPGRFLVLMPSIKRHGVSRKIEDEEHRQRLKATLQQLEAPTDMGVIVRTAGEGRTKRELQRDLAYLQRLYGAIQKRIKSAKAPSLLYQETDLVTRVIRDFFTPDTAEIVIDSEDMLAKATEFMQGVMPRYTNRVRLYKGDVPIFHAYGVEKHIESIYSRRVELPGGGYIVVDQAEALVAIDVNSGSYRDKRDPEENAFQLNMLAAKEVARQLRLRDLGGVIIIDFVDLADSKHIHAVEKALLDALKSDKARFRTLKMSEFGIVEMTRQRMRPSVRRSVFQECPHCHGSGQMRTPESIAINVLRLVPLALSGEDVRRAEITVGREVAQHLNNVKRRDLAAIEERFNKDVVVNADSAAVEDSVRFVCHDRFGAAREWAPPSELPASMLKAVERPVAQAAAIDEEDEEEAAQEAPAERETPKPVEVRAPQRVEEAPAEAAQAGAGAPGEGAPGQQEGEGERKGKRRRRDRRHRGGRRRSRRFHKPGGPEGVPGEGAPEGEPRQGDGSQPAPQGERGSEGHRGTPAETSGRPEQAEERREPEAPRHNGGPAADLDSFSEGL